MKARRLTPDKRTPVAREDRGQLEREIYALLQRALYREESAAKAAARIEFDLVQQHERQQAEPASAEAGNNPEAVASSTSSNEFASSFFQGMFTNLNVLKVLNELLDLIELPDDQRGAVVALVTQDLFRSQVGPAASAADEQFIGTDQDLYLHQLKQRAAIRQKQKSSDNGA